ncbi:hypothetical protein LOK74_23070 [Brevibacillus humidisoli]|uniref:hypothetical protein n=1 Tax=Brevibacillus humidisoli TaxID=2895522 RepID=UPI001E316A57|nr:hypothetical protein [Brevibacillus humidisoli]UFJ40838.1 hypothetical protein LOK74_23070 [Brevibacillus humidisoli]
MKKVTILLLTFALFLCAACSQIMSKTAEVVTVIEIREESILVENKNKEQKEIPIPKIVSGLIEKDRDYFIEYEHLNGQGKKLVSIQPIKSFDYEE